MLVSPAAIVVLDGSTRCEVGRGYAQLYRAYAA